MAMMILSLVVLVIVVCNGSVQSSLPCLMSEEEQLQPIYGVPRISDGYLNPWTDNFIPWGYVCCRGYYSDTHRYTASIDVNRFHNRMPLPSNSNGCNSPFNDPASMWIGSSTILRLSVDRVPLLAEDGNETACENADYNPCTIYLLGDVAAFLKDAHLMPCLYNPIVTFHCIRDIDPTTISSESGFVKTNQHGGFVNIDRPPIWNHLRLSVSVSEFNNSGAWILTPARRDLVVYDPDTWGTDRWNITLSVVPWGNNFVDGLLELDHDETIYPTAEPRWDDENDLLISMTALETIPALRLTRAIPYSECETWTPPYRFGIYLIATNPTGLSSTSTVEVIIEDENDRPPVFLPLASYTIILEESDLSGPSNKLPSVEAIDGDTGIRCAINYTMESGGNTFTVDSVCGQISFTGLTAMDWTYTSVHVYNVTVRAFEYNGTRSWWDIKHCTRTVPWNWRENPRCSEEMVAFQTISVEIRRPRKSHDGCPATKKLYPNGELFHWRPIPANKVSVAEYGRPIEYCPNPDFRRSCVGNPEEGFLSTLPAEPCRITPVQTTPIVTLLGNYLVNFPEDGEARQVLAHSVSQALANETNTLTVTDINYLTQFLSQTTEGLDNVISPDLFRPLVNIVSQISNASSGSQLQAAQSYSSSSNIIMTSLETLAYSVDLGPDGNGSVTVNEPNVAVQAFSIPRNAKLSGKTVLGFAARANSTFLNDITRENQTSALDSENAVSITLPESLMLRLYRQSVASIAGIRGHYLVFRDVSLLQYASSNDPSNISTRLALNQSTQFFPRIASWIIGASFGPSILDLADPITFRAQLDNYSPDKNHTCVFWNTTADDGHGAWQSNGCTLTNQTGRHITCQCNHLTSFAILVDFFAAEEGAASLPPFLDAMTTAALSLSIAGLLLTIGLILLVWKLTKLPSRRRALTKNEFVVLNLSVALLLAYVTFLAGIDAVTPKAGCIAAGAFIHYFFLVTSLWGGVEGYLLYQAFATAVPATEFTRFQAKASAIAWGIPVILVSIVLLLDPEYYAGKNVCWLHNQASLYLAFIAPICLALLANLVVFALVMRELWVARKAAIRSTKNKADIWTDLRRGISLFFLLGLPWLLLTLNVFYGATEGRLALHVLVIIFCGTQGFGIFAVHVYGVRRELKDLYLHHMKPNTAKRERNKKGAHTSSTSSS
ncbi:hypothetical protein BV898_13205 [Hypsibius exemplaris]|uniref:Uncharacterized protein n=1 Tax=Hypsibius exemplaris TaxID=2072580 RepID=A0A1W0WBH6_HYPEX|nr:hypothetical protein BV898_13205 [Hypsibius exemplaris]